MSQEYKAKCKKCEREFFIRQEDADFYKSIGVGDPTLCPNCRYQRRLINRNEWNLYQRKCDATGEQIISIYRSDAPFPVYKQSAWWADNWDPLSFGQEIDFSRSFFEQFYELSLKVPHLAVFNKESINSEYTNQSGNNKDCYLVVASNACEKCMYGNWYQAGCFLCGDCYDVEKSELCYECLNIMRCYKCAFSRDIADCTNCQFSRDLKGCSDCFGCVGLRNRQYYYFNTRLSKEEYQAKMGQITWTREFIEEMNSKARKFSLNVPHKFYHGSKNIDFSGDYIEFAKNVHSSFNCKHAENLAYAQDAWWSKDSWDVTEVFSQRSYECQGCVVANSIGMRSCWDTHDSYYSDMCFGSSDLFGCFGLRQKHYCIFNKQYTKEEYGKLKARLIEHMRKTGEWGEYFPASLTPFAYNESVAQDYFPLTKEQVVAMGLTWHDKNAKDYKTTLTAKALPKTIQEVDETIIKQVIRCSSQESEETKAQYLNCVTAYAIIPMELELYRTMNLPLPFKCFPCRRQDRFALRNPRTLWNRECSCGGEDSDNGNYRNQALHFHGKSHCRHEVNTSYSFDRPEIVYREVCYQAEVG